MVQCASSTIFKKKDGTLSISKDAQSVLWTPVAPPGAKPQVVIPISSVTSMEALMNAKVRKRPWHC